MADQRTTAAPIAKLIIVDDEPHMCEICSRTLRRVGYDVVTTSDPARAIQLLRGDDGFDLLLTDIKMPSLSGLDLAKIARERDPSISIIVMTGFASIENLHRAVQSGVADVLSKPFELEHLRLAVEQALHKRALLQDNLRLRTLEQLLLSSEDLSATLDRSQLVKIVLNMTLRHSGCRAGFVWLDEPGQLTASAPDAFLLEGGDAAMQRAHREHVTITNLIAGTAAGVDLRYGMFLPLRAQGEVHGVLGLCHDSPALLRPGMQEAVQILADLSGAALRNAMLYGQLDEAFRRRQELDRMKSEIIAIASHELRTPLSLIIGYSTMVREQLQGDERSYLDRVIEGSDRIKTIVDNMVALRHLDLGSDTLQEQRLDLVELILQSVATVRSAADDQSIQIMTDLPHDRVLFLSDGEKLTIMLNQLLSNAVKFTPAQGSITISARVVGRRKLPEPRRFIVQPTDQTPASWLIVTVQDTGIGIAEHQQERIFDRFYQVAASLTRERGGTGLGLALVRELAATLNGAVWLESREGFGSSFSLALPFRPLEVHKVGTP